MSSRIIAIVGPTAVGKSHLALQLAQRGHGGIVNADAMALYRGMDIATDKPDAAARSLVPHYALDLWPVTHTASVVEYRTAAREAIDAIWSRGNQPYLVGGSPLYLKAVCDELDIPPTEPAVRERYQQMLDDAGPQVLHQLLERRDPQAAALIDQNNGRRLVRALEVVELVGSFTAALPQPQPWAPTTWIGIRREREVIDARITARVDRWWEQGELRREVELLLTQGLTPQSTAGKAVGYQQMMAVLRGELTPSQARAETIAATRKLARRQERTLRADERITWFDGSDTDLLERVWTHLA